jgi:hypothetical protein
LYFGFPFDLCYEFAFQIWEIDLKPFDIQVLIGDMPVSDGNAVLTFVFKSDSRLVRAGVLNAGPHLRVSVRIWNVRT